MTWSFITMLMCACCALAVSENEHSFDVYREMREMKEHLSDVKSTVNKLLAESKEKDNTIRKLEERIIDVEKQCHLSVFPEDQHLRNGNNNVQHVPNERMKIKGLYNTNTTKEANSTTIHSDTAIKRGPSRFQRIQKRRWH